MEEELELLVKNDSGKRKRGFIERGLLVRGGVTNPD
jgi:hypothetical protein